MVVFIIRSGARGLLRFAGKMAISWILNKRVGSGQTFKKNLGARGKINDSVNLLYSPRARENNRGINRATLSDPYFKVYTYDRVYGLQYRHGVYIQAYNIRYTRRRTAGIPLKDSINIKLMAWSTKRRVHRLSSDYMYTYTILLHSRRAAYIYII